MRRRPLTLITATASVSALLLVAGCEAKVYGTTGAGKPTQIRLVDEPLGSIAPIPLDTSDLLAQELFAQPTAALGGLEIRSRQATAEAATRGAEISTLVLDRDTGQAVSNGNGMTLAIASVAKLFIADDLLLQESKGQVQLSPADRMGIETMLRSSDDSAAEVFWQRGGGSAIVTRVAARYGLTSTAPPGDGFWWNTVSTAADLVHYYDMLLTGSGGLPTERASIIIDNLAQSTPQGIDGYPQRFGIPEGLFAEPVAVKQGWMCCIGNEWMHLSTGLVGPDRRYIIVIGSMQPSGEDAARATITQAVKTMFPGGHI